VKGPDQELRVGLTFDDVLLVPRFSDVKSRRDADTTSRFSREITLSVPIVSANMDTVTESAMAIAMARAGGIGVIHRFLPLEVQVSEVLRVKRSESVVIEDPYTLGPEKTVRQAWEAIGEQDIGGIVIVDEKRMVLGLVTRRDITLEDRMDRKLKEVMTPRKDLVTAARGVALEEARKLLHSHKIEKLPLVDRAGRLSGLITSKDIMKRRQLPSATKDSKGRLRVAAAIGVKGDHIKRAERLLDVGPAGQDVAVLGQGKLDHGPAVRFERRRSHIALVDRPAEEMLQPREQSVGSYLTSLRCRECEARRDA
jgi:IMP dehydrogenase